MLRISMLSCLLLLASGLVADRAEAAWPPLRPDLQVVDMWSIPRLPKAGQPVTFSVSIKNAGKVSSPTGWLGVLMLENGSCFASGCEWGGVVTGMAPGETRVFTVASGTIWFPSSGLHPITAFVDDQNLVNEGNEANNQLTKTLTVVSYVPGPSGETSFLLNPGPRYRGGLTWVNDSIEQFVTCLGYPPTEGHLDGNPGGECSAGYACRDGTLWKTSDGSCESYYHDTRVGWGPWDHDRYPGWAIWDMSGGNGQPLEFVYINHALTAADSCTLREVGLIYNKWYDSDGRYNFRANPDKTPMRLGQFPTVVTRFTAKLGYQAGPPRCASPRTAYVTGDFRLKYVDGFGHPVRYDLLGIHVYEMAGSQKGNPVMWENRAADGSSWFMMLSGDALVPQVPQLVSGGFTTYEWRQKELLAQWLPPPPGYTIDDAIPYGWDVYTSVRGADLDFSLRESDIVGIR